MTLIKGISHLTIPGLLTLGFMFQLTTGASAQPQLNSANISIPTIWEAQPRPPKRGTPEGRESGATRGPIASCIQGNNKLTALVPVSGKGFTIDSTPTFFWYLPPTAAKSAEFVLLNDQDEEIYSTKFAIAGTSGLKSLTLPSSAGFPDLEIGKEYQWQLSLICNPTDQAADVFVEGFIERLPLTEDFVKQIQQAQPQQRLSLYASNRLWYDLLNILAAQRRLNPQNATTVTDWKKLLESVQLGNIAENPL